MRYRGGNVAGVAVTRVAIGGPEFFAMYKCFDKSPILVPWFPYSLFLRVE